MDQGLGSTPPVTPSRSPNTKAPPVFRWGILSLLMAALVGCATSPPVMYAWPQNVPRSFQHTTTPIQVKESTYSAREENYTVFQKNGALYGFDQKIGQLFRFDESTDPSWSTVGGPINE